MIRYQITDGSIAPRPDVDFIQVRNYELRARDLCNLVREIMASVKGPSILVNDRLDVALACGAQGVHLRDGAISPERIRRWFLGSGDGGDLIISVACHDAEGVRRAEAEGADYAILAPIFNPISKSPVRPPLGPETLGRIARTTLLPIIALGGITQANAARCLDAGAAGIAGISLFRL